VIHNTSGCFRPQQPSIVPIEGNDNRTESYNWRQRKKDEDHPGDGLSTSL